MTTDNPPMAEDGEEYCRNESPEADGLPGYICTCAKGHEGDHAAHDPWGNWLYGWAN